MRRALQNSYLVTKPKEINFVIQVLDLFYHDKPKYDALVDKTIKNDKLIPIMKIGYFSYTHLLQFCHELNQDKSSQINRSTPDIAMERLSEWGFVSVEKMNNTIIEGFWKINEQAKPLWSIPYAEDICFGVLNAIEKYRSSVPKIIVETENGDESIATGFIIEIETKSERQRVCITNKHVSGGAKVKKIKSIQGKTINYQWGRIFESDTFDLSLIVLSNAEDVPCFRFSTPLLLDEVISLGYPKVAVTAKPFLLVHKGEINGTIIDRNDQQEYLVVSCSVSPGNSGGPLINDAAEVVGVISQSSVFKGQGEETNEVGIHHLAVPTSDVKKFIDDFNNSN